jgi:hypothetical protein
VIVAILNERVVAHADLVSECYPVAKEIAEQATGSWTLIMRPAGPKLHAAIEAGEDVSSRKLSITDTAELAD